MSWTETYDCPARRMSAPILDNAKATDTKLKQAKPQDLKAQDSKSKDDSAEKKNVSELETVDRFDNIKPLECFQWVYLLGQFPTIKGLTPNKMKRVNLLKGFPGGLMFPCSFEKNIFFVLIWLTCGLSKKKSLILCTAAFTVFTCHGGILLTTCFL